MSYPPPPGPQNPPSQGRPDQQPGWQAPPTGQSQPGWQSQPYQPQGGNWAAPPYGGPPRRNRAGLIIILIVVLAVVLLSITGFLAYRLTAGEDNGGTAPAPAPSPTRQATPTAPSKTVPSAVPSKVPTKVVPTEPVPSQPATTKPLPGSKIAARVLAGDFVARLNAGNADGAAALACADTKSAMPFLIGAMIEAPTKLTVNDPVIGQDPYLVPVTGSTKGEKVSGTVITEGSCVKAFQLTPS